MCARRVFEKDTGMCTRKNVGEGCGDVCQEGILGRTLECAPGGVLGKDSGVCTKRDVWEGWWECAPGQVFGKDVGMCTKIGGFGMCGAASSGQEESHRDLSCPWLVCGEGRSILFAPPGFKWLLLNHYWRLIVGSICFNFSHGVGVAEEGSQQQREVLGCFASHPLLLFY